MVSGDDQSQVLKQRPHAGPLVGGDLVGGLIAWNAGQRGERVHELARQQSLENGPKRPSAVLIKVAEQPPIQLFFGKCWFKGPGHLLPAR